MRFLQELLADGPLPSTWVHAEGHACGHAERTLWRARARLNLVSLHSGGYGRGTRRFAALPGDPAIPLLKTRQQEDRQAAFQRIEDAMCRFEARRAGERDLAAVP